jgi:hypothetical protein
MKSKIAYQTDEAGVYLHPITLYEQPLDPGQFAVPYLAYEAAPPAAGEGQCARWVDGGWIVAEDHREAPLYAAGTGAPYEIGRAGAAGAAYDGFGPLPDWLTTAAPEPPPPTAEEIQAAFTAQIQQRLDGFAATRNYDGILSASTYATSAVEKFRAEGQYCVEARDATWAAAYAILDDVLAGGRPMPASIADIEADLPVLQWPE